MQNLHSPRDKWRNFVFPLAALLVIAVDQLTKTLIRTTLGINETLFELGFLRITHVHNTGAAFGMFPNQSLPLIIVAITGVTIVLLFAVFFPDRYPFLYNGLSQLALGLMLGGNVGNLVDRLRLGHVTDFISVGVWPTFNVADPAILFGVILLAYILLRQTAVEKAASSD